MTAAGQLTVAQQIEQRFHLGEPLDRIVAAGWSCDDVHAVLRANGWDLDASGRLPRSKRITSPSGLRFLPAEAMRATPVQPVAPPPVPARAVIGPPRGRVNAAQCGTPGGYRKHRRQAEDACRPCKDAEAAAQRDSAARQHPKSRPGPKLKPIVHGDMNGYRAHYRREELPVCDDCKQAYREHCRAKSEAKQASTVAGHVAAGVQQIAVECDTWFAAAQRSPHRQVRAAAAQAIAVLLQLRVAMDALARAERDAARAAGRTA